MTTSTSYINQYNFYVYSLYNAKLYVYTESSTGKFDYKGSISSGGSKTITIDSYEDAYVVVKPSSSSAYADFSVTGNYSYSTGSTKLAAGALTGIILGSICFIII